MRSYFVLSLESPLHYARCAPVSPSARDATPHSRQCSALWRTHPLRHALPLPCRHRQPPMPDARWQRRQRRTARQSQCLETWRPHCPDDGDRPLYPFDRQVREARQPNLVAGRLRPADRHPESVHRGALGTPHPYRIRRTTPRTRELSIRRPIRSGRRARPSAARSRDWHNGS